jgi:hypothetical protein
LLNGDRSILNQRSNGVYVAESVSRDQSILLVKMYLVVVVESCGDSTLRILR